MTLKKTNHIQKSIFARLLSSDHKDLGTYYLILAIISGVIGAAFSIVLRLALNGAHKGILSLTFLNDDNFVSFVNTAHALILIFFMVMPALLGGFTNWLLPLMIGTLDMAFPRLNRLAFWLLPLSIFFGLSSLFFVHMPLLMTLLLLVTVYCVSLSMLISFINFISTIITMRAPGMRLAKLPIFIWSVLVSSSLGLICLPVMLSAVTKMVLAGHFVSSNFSLMLWFFSHPEIYVLLLPAFGIVSQIISTFCNRQLFGQNYVVFAMIALGGISVVLWTNKLFQPNDFNFYAQYFFVALPLICLPMFVIVLSWLMTILQSHIRLQTPMLWALGFFFVLMMGLISSLQLVLATPFLQSLNSTAIVAHFHYILSLSAVFAIFSGWYFWLPKMSGYECRRTTTIIHFWVMFVGINAIFLPQHIGGLLRSGSVYFSVINIMSTMGAIMAGLSVIIFIYGLIETFYRKKKVSANPWGEGAVTLEWHLPSPPQTSWVRVPRI